MRKLFNVLKQKNVDQAAQGEAKERLKTIMEQAERMKRQVEDKLKQIQGSITTFTCLIFVQLYVEVSSISRPTLLSAVILLAIVHWILYIHLYIICCQIWKIRSIS